MQQLSPQTVTCVIVDQDHEEDSLGCVPVVSPFRIGRREGFDLYLTSRNVSGLHAEILEEENEEFWIHDLNSTNGTFVNGERIRSKTLLQDDDTIVFGNRTFRVMFADSALDHRRELSTVSNSSLDIPMETPEQRFRCLLETGAVPYFQPIHQISSDQQRLVGYEILGRSRIFGLRTPDQMFAAALELEKEAELSRVLRKRGLEAAEAKLATDMTLFVNAHPSEFKSSQFEESLHEIRETFATRPIVLELSEAILNDPDSFTHLRNVLTDLDISLALHDFGGGKIHLAELNAMAPEIVKFDGALVQGIDKALAKRQRLVRAMVKLVKELGITPMAEFIESQDEYVTLSQMGFEYGQGYRFGRPMNIDDIDASEDSRDDDSAGPVERATAVVVKDKARASSNQRPAKLMRQLDSKGQSDGLGDSDEDVGEVKDKHWLLEQEKSHYTIQLMMSPDQKAAQAFLADQDISGRYATYPKHGKGTTWVVVVYEIFSSHQEAKSKSEVFKSLGIAPWIRRISAIHSELMKANNVAAE